MQASVCICGSGYGGQCGQNPQPNPTETFFKYLLCCTESHTDLEQYESKYMMTELLQLRELSF